MKIFAVLIIIPLLIGNIDAGQRSCYCDIQIKQKVDDKEVGSRIDVGYAAPHSGACFASDRRNCQNQCQDIARTRVTTTLGSVCASIPNYIRQESTNQARGYFAKVVQSYSSCSGDHHYHIMDFTCAPDPKQCTCGITYTPSIPFTQSNILFPGGEGKTHMIDYNTDCRQFCRNQAQNLLSAQGKVCDVLPHSEIRDIKVYVHANDHVEQFTTEKCSKFCKCNIKYQIVEEHGNYVPADYPRAQATLETGTQASCDAVCKNSYDKFLGVGLPAATKSVCTELAAKGVKTYDLIRYVDDQMIIGAQRFECFRICKCDVKYNEFADDGKYVQSADYESAAKSFTIGLYESCTPVCQAHTDSVVGVTPVAIRQNVCTKLLWKGIRSYEILTYTDGALSEKIEKTSCFHTCACNVQYQEFLGTHYEPVVNYENGAKSINVAFVDKCEQACEAHSDALVGAGHESVRDTVCTKLSWKGAKTYDILNFANGAMSIKERNVQCFKRCDCDILYRQYPAADNVAFPKGSKLYLIKYLADCAAQCDNHMSSVFGLNTQWGVCEALAAKGLITVDIFYSANDALFKGPVKVECFDSCTCEFKYVRGAVKNGDALGYSSLNRAMTSGTFNAKRIPINLNTSCTGVCQNYYHEVFGADSQSIMDNVCRHPLMGANKPVAVSGFDLSIIVNNNHEMIASNQRVCCRDECTCTVTSRDNANPTEEPTKIDSIAIAPRPFGYACHSDLHECMTDCRNGAAVFFEKPELQNNVKPIAGWNLFEIPDYTQKGLLRVCDKLKSVNAPGKAISVTYNTGLGVAPYKEELLLGNLCCEWFKKFFMPVMCE